MTLQKAVDLFAILFDKYGSPNLSPSETIDYLNMGSNEYLNRLFPDNQGGVVNAETDSNTLFNLKPLIHTLTISMDGNGYVATTALETALKAYTLDPTTTVFRVMSVHYVSGGEPVPVKYTKHNNAWIRNVFKKPSLTSPTYLVDAKGFKFFPVHGNAINITVVKTPVVYSDADLTTNPLLELSDYTMYNIISIALKLAAVSVRETEVLEDVRLAGLQITQ